MKIVTFDKPWDKYAAGDTAGFDEECAAALLAGGVAHAQESAEPKAAGKKAAQTEG